MAKTRIIGDIHANFRAYQTIIEGVEQSIQVGDYGIGFRENPITTTVPHRFIRGNHDNPRQCIWEPNYIPDGMVEGQTMFIGGARSIDKDYRTEGLDYWSDEELTMDEFFPILKEYIKVKPNVIISHDCPEFLLNYFHIPVMNIDSNTRTQLQMMHDIHKPKLHIFGHWHFQFDKIINGCRFICLNINSFIDIDLEQEFNYEG